MSTRDEIKKKLKALRGEGVRIYAVAMAAGVTQSSLSRFLAGKRGLSDDTVAKLQAYFKANQVCE